MGLADFINAIGEQNNLSGLQDWAKAGGVAADPNLTNLAQLAPRAYAQIAPQLIQQQMGQQAITQLYGGNSTVQPTQSQDATTVQYGSQGDSNPNAPIPQGLPTQGASPLAQLTQSPTQPASNGLPDQSRLRALTVMSGGDPSKAIALAKTLAAPPGAGSAPEGMMYDPNNPGTLIRIQGSISKGQSEVDAPFAASYEQYNNAGGAQRTQDSIATVDNVIQQLKNKQITTGGLIDRLSMSHGEPTELGQVADGGMLAARDMVASAVLPLAKPLFGSRVTNFDAQSLVNSKGLDPLQTTDQNIVKLEQLKSEMISGQKDIENSGSYFQQHGTLAGYQKPSALATIAPQTSQQPYVPSQPSALSQVAPQQQNNNVTLQALLAEKARRAQAGGQ